MVKHFYIFRHGQCSHNLEGKIQGRSNNSVLTDQGIEQSYNTAYALKDKHIDVVISSPLRRAKQSSFIVSKITKAPLRFDDKLIEGDLGITEDEKNYKEAYNMWKETNDKNFHFEDGESKRQITQRVMESLEKYANSNYQNLAISGHEDALLEALRELNINKESFPNGEIVHLAYEEGRWKYLGAV